MAELKKIITKFTIKSEKIAGFIAETPENVTKKVEILTKYLTTSDDKFFYRLITETSNVFLSGSSPFQVGEFDSSGSVQDSTFSLRYS